MNAATTKAESAALRTVTAQEFKAALELNMHGLMEAVKNMTTEQAESYVIQVEGVSVQFYGNGLTSPAAADGASKLPFKEAHEIAPTITNGAGVEGQAVRYPSALNKDIIRCAAALAEITVILTELATSPAA